MNPQWKLGANYREGEGCAFQVWAPNCRTVEVYLLAPDKQIVSLYKSEGGYFQGFLPEIRPGARYFYRLDGELKRPDPASRWQPDGVHNASEVVDPEFPWQDHAWTGLPLRDYIFYEVHVGTFTPEGTFDAILSRLPDLKELGVTALQLMPIGQFPGARNWGYDGVFPFAVQNSYGGPQGLKRLVNAAHLAGLTVVLDVVYNHFGPEGNYLRDFGPYFTRCYKTPWGEALNFDGEDSDEVRRFFLENAIYWQRDFHIDGLRLDAVHAIRDFSAIPFLQELARATHREAERLGRPFHLIAESDLNDARVVRPETLGGYGLDAQWSDDFHHVLHVLLTGERNGYYEDFVGVSQLAKVFREGYAYTGEYSPFRKRRHGNSPDQLSAKQFVVYAQNHDQVGNRCFGERLSELVNFDSLKLAAGCVLLSPFLPLIFMGEEYGEAAPFQYFVSHTDPELVEAVRQGRRAEFAGFAGFGEAPDPIAEQTFQACALCPDRQTLKERHRLLRRFYQHLIRSRKELLPLAHAEKDSLAVQAHEAKSCLTVRYWSDAEQVLCLFCFADEPTELEFDAPAGQWEKVIDSAAPEWGGPGSSLPATVRSSGTIQLTLSPKSLAVFRA